MASLHRAEDDSVTHSRAVLRGVATASIGMVHSADNSKNPVPNTRVDEGEKKIWSKSSEIIYLFSNLKVGHYV